MIVRTMRKFWALCAMAALLSPAALEAQVGPAYVCGTIATLSSFSSGIFVIMTGSVTPTNCVSSPGAIMVIPNEAPAMVSTVLSRWLIGKNAFCFYTTATSGTYCAINQAAPSG